MSDISATYTKTIQEIINSNSNKTKRNTGELGKDDFLNLLVTQLRYQDPLSPTDNTEFIGQMAQFSALEQMQNLNNSFMGMMAYSLIGKNVLANIIEVDGSTSQIMGAVTSVSVENGKYYLIIDDNTSVAAENVIEVYENTNSFENTLSAYTSLIGCDVNGIVYSSETGDMIKVSGNVASLQKGVYEDYAVLNDVSVEISGLYRNTVYTTDPDYLRKTLTEASENGKTISVVITDSSTGKKVPLSVKIKSLDFSDPDSIKAIVDEVHAPLDSITNIRRPSAAGQNSAGVAGDEEQAGA